MGDMRIIVVEGASSNGDIDLKVTDNGEMEIAMRLEKMLSILTEVGVKDLEGPSGLLKGGEGAVADMLRPVVRAHLMVAMGACLNRLVERDTRMVESMMREAPGGVG